MKASHFVTVFGGMRYPVVHSRADNCILVQSPFGPVMKMIGLDADKQVAARWPEALKEKEGWVLYSPLWGETETVLKIERNMEGL